MTTTRGRLGTHGEPVPEHERVPACDVGACNVCGSCGSVHHGGGDRCIGCWIYEGRWR